ncbi:MAG TPA: LptF/LptG family permease [Flavobacterium sp.]|uniref:LptF/LptG family permease n=1 Tax=unclassified Flavobacterium TaxID=196869 RepID=UPI0025BAC871|nr:MULTISPECIES: LptF/LptG family permease [unclassified Flavobacterium]HRE78866.1 LptF/LptG family permease [Flavobacterium sp.]
MKIIDKYILKRYLATFTVMLLLFIPIGIVIDVAEKINKILESKVPLSAVAIYYLDFTVYFANLLFPIFLFLSVIWFTSKLANNTEIIAILSSGISFSRFLRPYIMGATIVSVFALLMGFFLVPKASKGFNDFRYTYLKNNREIRQNSNVFRQISDDEFLYVSNFNSVSKTAFNFTLEKFKGEKLDYKITANRLKWNEKDSTYTMFNYQKRKVGVYGDILEKSEKKDTIFSFDLEDLTPVIYIAETLTLPDLVRFIDKEKARGNANINTYLVVLYRKYSLPVAAFILTIIAVAVSSMKRRGGMGVNLAIGIVIAFTYIFFDKIFGTMAEKSSIPPFVAVWFPNFVFGLLAIYLLRNAKR